MHRYEEGEERQRDAQRGGKHGHEELSRSGYGGMPARHALAELLHVVVDDDHGVVHHHAERNDKGCQRDGVQLHPEKIKQTHR